MYTHRYIHAHIHTYIYTCINAYVHTYIYTYRHTYRHTYTHTCAHTYIHTCTHTYIHTYILSGTAFAGVPYLNIYPGLEAKGYNINAFSTDIRAIYLCGFGWSVLALYLMLVSYADKKK